MTDPYLFRQTLLVVRLVEVVGEHVVRRLPGDRDSVLDRGAEVDAAPDARVADVVRQIVGAGEVTVSQAREARDRVVDLRGAQESCDDEPAGRGEARVRARVLGNDTTTRDDL